MSDPEVPEDLQNPKDRGSEEELQRRFQLSAIGVKHLQDCREQLSDVLTGIEDANIEEQPVKGTMIIDGISAEQKSQIERVGKARGLIKGAMDDTPAELVE